MNDDIAKTRAWIERQASASAAGIGDGGGRQGPPVDRRAAGADDPGMEKRLTILETRWADVIPLLATKGDLSDMALKLMGIAIGIAAISVTLLIFVINRALPLPTAPQAAPIILQIPAPTIAVQSTPSAPAAAPVPRKASGP